MVLKSLIKGNRRINTSRIWQNYTFVNLAGLFSFQGNKYVMSTFYVP